MPLTIRQMMAGASVGMRAGGPGSGRHPGDGSLNLSDRATGNKVAGVLMQLGYKYGGGGRYSHPDGYRAVHVNPSGFVNRLRFKDADEDHMANVERELDEKGLLSK